MFCLRVATDPTWAREAVKDLDAVLVDHAHCEMKAASNALSLVVRHPDDLRLVQALTELAREELEHFARVVSFIERRGLALGAPPIDDYAAALRRAQTRLPASSLPLVVDRLLFSALIEARSCERFKLLIEALPENTPEDLRALYEELFACEARHYRRYVDLAILAVGIEGLTGGAERPRPSEATGVSRAERGRPGGRADVEARLELLAEAEGNIVRALADRGSEARATVHG